MTSDDIVYSIISIRPELNSPFRCLTTEDTPFTPKANFTVTTTAAGVSIYNSGEFEMAMFEEQNTVYFKCELDTCLKDNDPTCTVCCFDEITQNWTPLGINNKLYCQKISSYDGSTDCIVHASKLKRNANETA